MPNQSLNNGLLSAQNVSGLLINTPHFQALHKERTAELNKQHSTLSNELNKAIYDNADDSEIASLRNKLWHCVRSFGISGSNASVVLGQNKYKSAYEYFNELTGRVIPNHQGNIFTEWGHRLEDAIASKFADDHKVNISEMDTFISSAFPFMSASIDRVIVDSLGNVNSVLEIKTAGFNTKNTDENGEIDLAWGKGNQYILVRNDDGSESLQLVSADSQCPVSYITQVLHYMLASGVYKGYLAVLIGGHDYREFTIPWDQEAAEAQIRAEDYFWCHHVLDDIPPAMTAKELGQVMPVKKSTIEATPEIIEMAKKYKVINDQLSELKSTSDALKDMLIEFVGTNESITYNDKPLVSYSACKGRQSVDVEALKEAYTKLALANHIEPQEFTKQGASYRRFSVKIKD